MPNLPPDHILLKTRDLRLLEMLEGASLPPIGQSPPPAPLHDFLVVAPGLAFIAPPVAPPARRLRQTRRVSLA